METPSRRRGFIDLLVADLTPTPRHALERRIARAVVPGVFAAFGIALLLWGPRPDMAAAVLTASFWVKAATTFLLGLCGLVALIRLARPRGVVGSAGWIGLGIVSALGVAAAIQLGSAAPAQRLPMLWGGTSAVCPWLIILLSMPLLLGAFRVLRTMAPTRLGLAGAAAGFTSGAFAAFGYASACDESAMVFVFVWYGSAIAATSIIGALLGPTLLRW